MFSLNFNLAGQYSTQQQTNIKSQSLPTMLIDLASSKSIPGMDIVPSTAYRLPPNTANLTPTVYRLPPTVF